MSDFFLLSIEFFLLNRQVLSRIIALNSQIVEIFSPQVVTPNFFLHNFLWRKK